MKLKKTQKKSCVEMAEKGISSEQAYRLLEDAETICLAVRLTQQAISGFKRDFEGMLNGNNKGGKK